MNILFLAIPLAIVLGAGFLFSFVWAVENDQFIDLETPAYRILFDQDNQDNQNTDEETNED